MVRFGTWPAHPRCDAVAMPKPGPADPPPARQLSDTAQAAASVALAAYLLGLVLSIAGNSVSGSSALVRTIKGRLFSPWMAPAWLDLGFDHPLTYGMPEDADHVIELRRFVGGDPVRLPGPRTGERAARWRRLARRIAAAVAEDAAAPLAAGVGRGGFQSLAAEDVVVRVLRTPLAERSSPPASPRLVSAYAARVREVAGEVQLIELGGAAKRGELAPLIGEPAGGRAASDAGAEP
jgi:hypothetical protein